MAAFNELLRFSKDKLVRFKLSSLEFSHNFQHAFQYKSVTQFI